MKSSRSRPVHTALLLALAALVALAAVPALSGAASAGAPAAHAAKARCRARGRGARRCRRAARRPAAGGGKVPRPFTPLTGPDNLNVLVLPQRQRGGPTIEVVQVRRGNVEATCTGAAQPYTKVFAFYGTGRLSGASFAGTLRFPQGNYQQVQGRFVTDRKATGTLSMGGIRMPDGAVCATGDVPFTATR